MANEKAWNPTEDEMIDMNRELLNSLHEQRQISTTEFKYYLRRELDIVNMMNRINDVFDSFAYDSVFLLVLSVFKRKLLG